MRLYLPLRPVPLVTFTAQIALQQAAGPGGELRPALRFPRVEAARQLIEEAPQPLNVVELSVEMADLPLARLRRLFQVTALSLEGTAVRRQPLLPLRCPAYDTR